MTEQFSGQQPRIVESVAASEALGALCAVLWNERDSLERLLFKLVEEQLVLSSGQTRWLHLADDELRAASAALRDNEIVRAAELDLLARRLELPTDISLATLADISPEPWSGVLADHRVALRALMQEVAAVAAENRRLAEAGAQATSETLDRLGNSSTTYNARGTRSFGRPGISILDEHA